MTGLAGASGCLERPLKAVGPRSTAVISEKLTQSAVDKIDLVLAIDNSRSMADKQQILALAVPDLVKGLVNPACIDPANGAVVSTPDGPLAECPTGTKRDFDPVVDIHIGIISSSLGGHGSDACNATGAGKASNDDKGHLLSRKDPTTADMVVTYQGFGFLAWDPKQKLNPPGEADIDADSAVDPDSSALVPSLRDMVIGVGQIGCGYEAQLESWYRFLVDPSPPESITLDKNAKVVLNGTDKVLLDQRKRFLRPDSLLAVIMLTDENDCSIRESGQFYFAAQQKTTNGSPFHLPKARTECDTDPNNECCFSCGQTGPKDDKGNPICAADPSCKTADGKTVYLDETTDNINLRCWNQKRRFGIDFLYGTDRYQKALSSTTVTDRNGSVVANPIFSDLDQSDQNTNIRTSGLIFLAGIVGVPWQDIARTDSGGKPDLKTGLDQKGDKRGGFKNASEMAAILPGKEFSTWDVVLGRTENYPAADALPKDPGMIESIDERSGTNPITGDALAPAGGASNPINGNEWTIPKRDDLQYACIFPLVKVDQATGNITPDTRDCSVPGKYAGCDCEDKLNNNPLCQPAASGGNTDQTKAKAYPGLRELQVLRDVGAQGIVASVCPAQLNAPKDTDFGYRPAIGSIIDRLKQALGGQCLSRTLTPDKNGQVQCLIIEASKVDASKEAACNKCTNAGRDPVADAQQPAVDAIQSDNKAAGYNCFCEISQLENKNAVTGASDCASKAGQGGYDLCSCQYTKPDQVVPAGVDGWCYIDETSGIGAPEIVEKCAESEKRLIRFVNNGTAAPGATLFITCTGDTASN
ncbi:MAG: hypothetical protein U0441_15525 [Polyangiaceae bacterium]